MEWNIKALLPLLAALLAVIEAMRRWIADVHKSRLLKPKAFDLPPVPEAASIYASPAEDFDHYLVGREVQIGALTRTVQNRALVFVSGPSGVGKSTLLKLGVARHLMQTGAWLPVYVDVWGADWQEGPLQALTDALQVAVERGLGSEARRRLALPGAVTIDNVFVTLSRLRPECGRRPALVFDQIDDYLNRHGQKLIDPADRTVLTAGRLARENTFWGEVCHLLSVRAIHCVFAIRSDAAAGLETFRFEEPAVVPVYRLSSSHVRSMIDHLANSSAVSRPENGFRQLVDRLAADLEHSGENPGVLPIQMRVVLSGLVNLRRLTSADLRKAGGVEGLEAASLERHLRQAPGSRSLLLALLRQLVHPEGGMEGKTVAKTFAELAAACHVPEAALTLALQTLEREGVLRQRWDPASGEMWQLYHDYLARAVALLERKEHTWRIYLAEKAEAFERSAGLERYRALLSPASLLRLVWERLRGRLSFKPYGGYLAWSAPRLVLNLWVLLAAGLAYAASVYRNEEAGQHLARSFDVQGGELEGQEERALWGLAVAPPAVRKVAIRDFLDSPIGAQRFLQRRFEIASALSGMDSGLRKAFAAEILPAACYASPPEDEEILGACATFMYHWEDSQETTSRFVTAALQRQSRSPALAWLANLRDRLETPVAEQLTGQILATVAATGDEVDPRSLYWAAGLLAERLGPPWGLRTAQHLLADMDRGRSFLPSDDENAGPKLVKLAGGLAGDEATLLADQLMAALERPVSDDDYLFSDRERTTPYFAQALGALAGRLELSQASSLVERCDRLGARVGQTPRDLIRFPRSLDLARARLAVAAGQIEESALEPVLLERLRFDVDYVSSDVEDRLVETCTDAVGIRKQPSRVFLEAGAGKVLAALESSADIYGVPELAACLAQLRGGVDEAGLRRGAEAVLRQARYLADPEVQARMVGWMYRSRLEEIGKALGSMAEHLSPAEARWAFPVIVRMILEENSNEIDAMGLPDIARRISRDEARGVIDQILRHLELLQGSRNGPAKQAVLGSGLAALTTTVGEDPALFRATVRRIRPLSRPPCAAAAHLAARENLPELIELLKWPTCAPYDETPLIRRIAEFHGADPDRFLKGDPSTAVHRTRFWSFVDWIEGQTDSNGLRFDLHRPPVSPFEGG